VREFGIREENVEFVGPRSPDTWMKIVRQSDLALHFHTSTFGHLSPFIQLSLADGCPVAVARSAQGEDFPSDVVFQVVPGVHEATEIEAIVKLACERGRTELGREGAYYIRQTANTPDVAARLSDNLRAWAPQVGDVMRRWDELQGRARTELLREVQGLMSDNSHATADPFELTVLPYVRELGWG
jgi:hypothetical protein